MINGLEYLTHSKHFSYFNDKFLNVFISIESFFSLEIISLVLRRMIQNMFSIWVIAGLSFISVVVVDVICLFFSSIIVVLWKCFSDIREESDQFHHTWSKCTVSMCSFLFHFMPCHAIPFHTLSIFVHFYSWAIKMSISKTIQMIIAVRHFPIDLILLCVRCKIDRPKLNAASQWFIIVYIFTQLFI